MILKIKQLHNNAIIPTKSHDGDLGYDLYLDADWNNKYDSKSSMLLTTGIACEFPIGYGAIIKDRSSIASNMEIYVKAGVIDNGYTGEIKILMINPFKKELSLNRGTKIAQMILVPVISADIEIVSHLTSMDDRGSNGFGSTGNKK